MSKKASVLASRNTSPQRRANRGLRKRCGCPRSKWPKCEHRWHFNYKWNGVHHRISLDKYLRRRIVGKTEAEREASRLKIAIEEGHFGEHRPARDTLTVAQLLAAYVKEYVTLERPRSLTNVGYQVGAIAAEVLELPTGERRAFGDWHVRDVGTVGLRRLLQIWMDGEAQRRRGLFEELHDLQERGVRDLLVRVLERAANRGIRAVDRRSTGARPRR